MRTLSYEYDVSKLWLGAHYGNLAIHARTDARSNLAGLWYAMDDQVYCGRMVLQFVAEDQRLIARSTQFNAEHQTTLHVADAVEVRKTFFVPYGTPDLCCAYTIARARNFLETPLTLTIEVSVQYPQFAWAEYVKLPDLSQKEKRVHSELQDGLVVTRTIGRENEVRVLGSNATLLDSRFDERAAHLRYTITIEPQQESEAAFVMVISNAGVADALARYSAAARYQEVFEQTQQEVSRLISVCDVLTPDPVITRAIKWAKINMLRDQRRYPIGPSFTNDPPQDILVVRDVAWFTVGCDYFTPWFSRQGLELVRDYGVEPGGQITEYILACETPPYKSNYGLNINDDTPLFSFAVHHHYALTKDRAFLESMYETVRNAADWILAQKHAGLIWCNSEESNLWGICSWRNVIPEYQLNGAVTEINAECYMALYLASRTAEVLGKEEDAARFREEALALKENINSQLVSEQTGLYLLNIDYHGVRHHDLTGDMIFPVLFGVATDEMKERVLATLSGPEFWTEYGVRTVAPGQPNYDPELGLHLLGGVWPNLTAWVAYAGRIDRPDLVVEAMRNIFRISEVPEPIAFKNVVPGQFPERLHGENFQSRGMALSPWMPPTYLWLAMDGLLGFRPSIDRLIVQPHLPESWQWVAVRNFPYAGVSHSLFYYLGTLYSTLDVQSGYPVELFTEDVSDQIECNAYMIALRRDAELTIFISVPERQGVRLRLLPPLVEQERVMEFLMNPGSAQVVTLQVTPQQAEASSAPASASLGVHVDPAPEYAAPRKGRASAARVKAKSRGRVKRTSPGTQVIERDAAVIEHLPLPDGP